MAVLQQVSPSFLNRGLNNYTQQSLVPSLLFVFLIMSILYSLFMLTTYNIVMFVRYIIDSNIYSSIFNFDFYKEIVKYGLLNANIQLAQKLVHSAFATIKDHQTEAKAVVFMNRFVDYVHLVYGGIKRLDSYLLYHGMKSSDELNVEGIKRVHKRFANTHMLCDSVAKFMFNSVQTAVMSSIIDRKIFNYIQCVHDLVFYMERDYLEPTHEYKGAMLVPSKFDMQMIARWNIHELDFPMTLHLDGVTYYDVLREIFGFTHMSSLHELGMEKAEVDKQLHMFLDIICGSYEGGVKIKKTQVAFFIYWHLKMLDSFFQDMMHDLKSVKDLVDLKVTEMLSDELYDIDNIYAMCVRATCAKLLSPIDIEGLNNKLCNVNDYRNMFLSPFVLTVDQSRVFLPRDIKISFLFRDVQAFMAGFTTKHDMRSVLKNHSIQVFCDSMLSISQDNAKLDIMNYMRVVDQDDSNVIAPTLFNLVVLKYGVEKDMAFYDKVCRNYSARYGRSFQLDYKELEGLFVDMLANVTEVQHGQLTHDILQAKASAIKNLKPDDVTLNDRIKLMIYLLTT